MFGLLFGLIISFRLISDYCVIGVVVIIAGALF